MVVFKHKNETDAASTDAFSGCSIRLVYGSEAIDYCQSIVQGEEAASSAGAAGAAGAVKAEPDCC